MCDQKVWKEWFGESPWVDGADEVITNLVEKRDMIWTPPEPESGMKPVVLATLVARAVNSTATTFVVVDGSEDVESYCRGWNERFRLDDHGKPHLVQEQDAEGFGDRGLGGGSDFAVELDLSVPYSMHSVSLGNSALVYVKAEDAFKIMERISAQPNLVALVVRHPDPTDVRFRCLRHTIADVPVCVMVAQGEDEANYMRALSCGEDCVVVGQPMTPLKKWFGFDGYRPGQEEAIDAICDGKDCLAILPTSAGKSLTYQLPGLITREVAPNSVTLVISPLISLMIDQASQLNAKFGLDQDGRPHRRTPQNDHSLLPIACFLGSAQADRLVEPRAARGEYAFVLICPESLDRLMPSILTMNVTLVAIDEAHCLSSHGHDFRPAYRELGVIRQALGTIPIIALTATANETVAQDIVQSLRFRKNYSLVRTSANRPNIYYTVKQKNGIENDVHSIVEDLNDGGSPAFLYTITRKEAEKMAGKLFSKGVQARSYHAGMSVQDRENVMEQFMTGTINVLCCTVAAGMGIDKSDVRLVLHYGLSRNIAAYSQESGRGGRDGALAKAVLYVGGGDAMTQRRFIENGDDDNAEQRLADLAAMHEYANAKTCRRRLLLAQFEEELPPGPCTLINASAGCDVCEPKKAAEVPCTDCTTEAHAILNAVSSLKYFGKTRVIAFVRGAADKKTQKLKNRTGFGLLATVPTSRVKLIVDAMIEVGLLQNCLSQAGFPRLACSSKGLRAIATRSPVLLPIPAAASTKRKRSAESSGGSSKRAKAEITELDSSGQEIHRRVTQWRQTTAQQKRVPSYCILSNSACISVALQKPTDHSGLLACHGVGKKIVEKYGDTILELVKPS